MIRINAIDGVVVNIVKPDGWTGFVSLSPGDEAFSIIATGNMLRHEANGAVELEDYQTTEILKDDDQTTEVSVDQPIEAKPPKLLKKDLKKMTIPELQKLADDQGIVLAAKMRKAAIIKFIIDHVSSK